MNLNQNYFQKCRVFLYPLLNIEKGLAFYPKEVYTAWEDYYLQSDYKLMLLFDISNHTSYKEFESEKLFKNKYFLDFVYITETQGIYVFDLSEHKTDYDNFILGKYSKFTTSHKERVLNFQKKGSKVYDVIKSFLYPEKYFKMYSELLGIKERILIEVGELCNKSDVDKETLKLKPMSVVIK